MQICNANVWVLRLVLTVIKFASFVSIFTSQWRKREYRDGRREGRMLAVRLGSVSPKKMWPNGCKMPFLDLVHC